MAGVPLFFAFLVLILQDFPHVILNWELLLRAPNSRHPMYKGGWHRRGEARSYDAAPDVDSTRGSVAISEMRVCAQARVVVPLDRVSYMRNISFDLTK